MENKISAKRGWILFLVIASIAIFIGLIWIIATTLPRNLFGFSNPSNTPSASENEKNCTYPIAYWIAHPELYPAQIVLGNTEYGTNEIHEALSTGSQDPRAQLQAQLVCAFLNITAGADQGMFETTIFQAYSWLVTHTDGNQVSQSDLEMGSRYYSLLEAYNLGLAGVPLCEDGSTYVYMDTPTSIETASPTFTLPSSQMYTSTPSETASPTYTLVTPISTYILPSNTPLPTTRPPGGQEPTVTRTPPASPTKTHQEPTPTRTPIPNTPTFTPPPQPTSTYTPPPLPTPTP